MRIQHNIAAMNSYRNYTGNANALSKNLEKLSSGYKINRAGDDAAGLAISEKMRAQITGLDAAQKNVKDGISLVKTAEGALQEVQDMMNRMVTLATQSANGTYDNNVDRANLQKEVEALKTEIDRIADSSNFNGTKLLDGSLASDATSSVKTALDEVKGTLASKVQDVNATKAKSTVTAASLAASAGKWAVGQKITMNFSMSDGSLHSIELTVELDEDNNAKFVDKDGVTVSTKTTTGSTAATIAYADAAKALEEALNTSELGKTYTAKASASGAITLEAMVGGAKGANITSVSIDIIDVDGKTSLVSTDKRADLDNTTTGTTPAKVVGADKNKSIDLGGANAYTGVDGTGVNSLEKAVFEIGGEKFVFFRENNTTLFPNTPEGDAKKAASIAAMEKEGIHFVKTAGDTATQAEIAKMAALIEKETGMKATLGTNDGAGKFTEASNGNMIMFTSKTSSTSGATAGGGLQLQIGDTADEYNQLKVAIQDMHVDALGLGSLDISKQASAQAAVDKIKAAINTVSGTRGDLGAIQNRLEHTTNNLAVMTENIQDAESTIRDVDIADEMTTYTKNNILLQSAQAMLAQANQMPQGVLQLLQ